MSDKQINTVLSEQGDYEDVAPISMDITIGGGAGGDSGYGNIWLEVKDDRFTTQQGVLVELYQGELRVVVWADSEQEDPTHTILIEPMSEEFRKEYDKQTQEDIDWVEYNRRVQALEKEGLTRSDAQGVVDAEDLTKKEIENA